MRPTIVQAIVLALAILLSFYLVATLVSAAVNHLNSDKEKGKESEDVAGGGAIIVSILWGVLYFIIKYPEYLENLFK